MMLFEKYILFLNDTEDDYHFGCSATSIAIKNELKNKFNKKIISINVQDIWHIPFSPQNEADFFSKKHFNKYIKENKNIINLIKNSYEIYVNGEGTILGFNNRTGTQNLLYLIYIAEKFNKKVSLINHSCFPKFSIYKENQYEKIYKTVYNNLYRCVVRDIRSLAILNTYGCKNVTLGFDCSPLYIKNTFKEVSIPYKTNEYVSLSGGIRLSQYFKTFLVDNVEQFKKINKKVVFLMSDTKILAQDDLHCLKQIEEFNKTSDFKIEVFRAKNTDEFLTFIKNAYYQITGRFHHSIIAAYFDTPFKVYETHSPKTEIFCDLFPNSEKHLSLSELVIDDFNNNSSNNIDKNYILNLCLKNFKD